MKRLRNKPFFFFKVYLEIKDEIKRGFWYTVNEVNKMNILLVCLSSLATILSVMSIYVSFSTKNENKTFLVKSDKKISNMEKKIDSFVFMTQKQYEKEYDLFWNLFDLLQQTLDKTKSIRGSVQLLDENSEPELQETYMKLIQGGIMKSSDSLNELENQLNQYEPFIEEMLFSDFKEIVSTIRAFQQRRFNFFKYQKVSKESTSGFLEDITLTLERTEEQRQRIVVFLRDYFENIRVS